tara:strand:+ start:1629 stop:3362 length:1734 start_codon:yes stop_codon:yes gene_type:complete
MFSKNHLSSLFKVLEPDEKKKIFLFFLLVLIIMFLETFSLGMFYPFLQSVTGGEVDNFFIEFFNEIKKLFNLNFETEILALLVLSFLILIKNIISYSFEIWQLNYLRDLKINLKNKLLKAHFKIDYETSSNEKISRYIRDFTASIDQFVKSLQNTMLLIIEIFVFLGITILLIILQSKGVIYLSLIIFLIAGLFSLFQKKILSGYGAVNLSLQEKSASKLIDLLNSTKELIAFDKSSLFIKQFKKIEWKSLNVIRNTALIQKFPKFFFEILVVFSFTIFIYFSKRNGLDLKTLVPQLGLIFFATIRLLPALTKALFYTQKLQASEAAALKISNDISFYNSLVNTSNTNKTEINFDQKIELRNVFFKYKSRNNYALENVNLEISKNDFVGIYGESGGGKSTLIDIISGFLSPSKGKIFIDGKEINNLNQTLWIDKIGYLTQENNLLDETIKTNITFEYNDENINKDFFKKVCKESGLEELINHLPQKENTEIGQKGHALSGGERQRIGIARLLYAKKQILIFDESTSNLDDFNKEMFISTVKNLSNKKTILLISHDQSVIKNCMRIFNINNKTLLEQN